MNKSLAFFVIGTALTYYLMKRFPQVETGFTSLAASITTVKAVKHISGLVG